MDANALENSSENVPLVVDVDETLLRTDVLYETFWKAFGRAPVRVVRNALRHSRSPARFARDLAGISKPDVDLLPLQEELLVHIRSAREKGRDVHLVSGARQSLVDAIANRLDLPGPHFGSTPLRRLTGGARAEFLKDRFGRSGYDYAGHAPQDLPSWEAARQRIAVAPHPLLRMKLLAEAKPVDIIGERWRPMVLIEELRLYQWMKNILLFLPLVAAHQFGLDTVLPVALAAAAFSLGASAIYILNDLIDLEADRIHPEKRNRPIASGRLPITAAMAASALLGLLALSLALTVGPPVAALTLLYMASSLSYSLWLKRLRGFDVLALAFLFTLRILTGASAAGIPVPPTLLALSFVALLALACVKRVTALKRLNFRDHLPGRSYAAPDGVWLERTAYAMVPAAGALFLIYAFEPQAEALYTNKVLLILAGIPLLGWLYRVIRLSAQGREDYDPLRFVLHDRAGLALLCAGAVLVLLAA